MKSFEELMNEKSALINAIEFSSDDDMSDAINQYLDDAAAYVRERCELLGIKSR